MARVSVETAKSVITSLLSEQERDRENLLRMLAHSEKMIGHLQLMRDEEEARIDTEANERKQAVRKMFAQLIAVEEERKERLQMHVADIEGQKVMAEQANPPSANPPQPASPRHLKAVTKPSAA
jgi:hypothetical protein